MAYLLKNNMTNPAQSYKTKFKTFIKFLRMRQVIERIKLNCFFLKLYQIKF